MFLILPDAWDQAGEDRGGEGLSKWDWYLLLDLAQRPSLITTGRKVEVNLLDSESSSE